MSKYIDRVTKEIKEENSPTGANFLYNNFFGRIILKLATKRFTSRIVGKYLDSKMSIKLINNFIKDNNINMNDYQNKEYKSFNEFFSRKIKNGKRTFSNNKNDFCSPCDCKLSVYKINDDKTIFVKGKEYTTESILRDESLAKEYKDGYMFVFRLGVTDYHRYCYIDDGRSLSKKQINGKFHTTSPVAFKRYKVFQENQREYEVLKTKNFGEIIQMEVGAMLVGKIVNNYKKTFNRSDEKGYFLYGGSTIIIMIKKDILEVDKDIIENSNNDLETCIKQGEKIAKKV